MVVFSPFRVKKARKNEGTSNEPTDRNEETHEGDCDGRRMQPSEVKTKNRDRNTENANG